jgi:lipopolysaccharide heptosyltransferase II
MTVARTDLWRNARRILAVRLDNLGDVLMTTPALRALKEAHPERHVTLLTSRSGAVAAPNIPEIDAVLAADAPWMPGAYCPQHAAAALVDMLRSRRFDAAVVFTVYSQSALPAALACLQAGVPLRLAHSRENPYGLLTDWVPDPEPHEVIRHEVRRQLDLVASVGARTANEKLSFRVRPQEAAQAMAKLRRAGLDLEGRWVVVHPGATAASRRYPPEQYAQAIDALLARRDLQVVLTGSEAERPLVESIRSRARRGTFTLAGELALGELAAVLAPAAMLIANNTGPVHLAAALGTPVVDLYALTNPQHGPWQVPHRVLYHDVPCRFCYRSVCAQGHNDCLRRVSPERVAAAARSLLERGADRWDVPREAPERLDLVS